MHKYCGMCWETLHHKTTTTTLDDPSATQRNARKPRNGFSATSRTRPPVSSLTSYFLANLRYYCAGYFFLVFMYSHPPSRQRFPFIQITKWYIHCVSKFRKEERKYLLYIHANGQPNAAPVGWQMMLSAVMFSKILRVLSPLEWYQHALIMLTARIPHRNWCTNGWVMLTASGNRKLNY